MLICILLVYYTVQVQSTPQKVQELNVSIYTLQLLITTHYQLSCAVIY